MLSDLLLGCFFLHKCFFIMCGFCMCEVDKVTAKSRAFFYLRLLLRFRLALIISFLAIIPFLLVLFSSLCFFLFSAKRVLCKVGGFFKKRDS